MITYIPRQAKGGRREARALRLWHHMLMKPGSPQKPGHVLICPLPHLSEQQCSLKRHWYASHIKDTGTKNTWTLEKDTKQVRTDNVAHFLGAIWSSYISLTTSILCHRVWHIDHAAAWAIDILHAVISKDFKKRFMKTPEWSLAGGLVGRRFFFFGEIFWDSWGTMVVL